MSTAASVKLSPAIKSLISLPRARPNSLPSPGSKSLSDVFGRIAKGGETGGVGRETWLTLLTAGVMTINSPASLCQLYDFAAGSLATEERAKNVMIMRETGLKCISFNGIPRTINGLGALRAHLPEDVVSHLGTKPFRGLSPSNVQATMQRGRELWDDIYEPHSSKLLQKLADSHPDLPVHILSSHYSSLLSDPFPSSPGGGYKIGRVLTSVIAMTCLRGQGGVGPQVTSHVFGLKKALLPNAPGTQEDQVQGQEWLVSDDGVQWVLESTDEVAEVITKGQVSFAGGPARESKL